MAEDHRTHRAADRLGCTVRSRDEQPPVPIGAPDAVLVSTAVRLLRSIATVAPRIGVTLIHLMPAPRGGTIGEPWQQSLDMLERRELDVAMLPLPAVSPRFEARSLYDEDFVWPYTEDIPWQKRQHALFSQSQHLLVSLSGEARGFVDEMLAKRGLARRIALTVPNFLMALVQLSGSDLITSMPRRLVEHLPGRFGLVFVELPFARKPDTIRNIRNRNAAIEDHRHRVADAPGWSAPIGQVGLKSPFSDPGTSIVPRNHSKWAASMADKVSRRRFATLARLSAAGITNPLEEAAEVEPASPPRAGADFRRALSGARQPRPSRSRAPSTKMGEGLDLGRVRAHSSARSRTAPPATAPMSTITATRRTSHPSGRSAARPIVSRWPGRGCFRMAQQAQFRRARLLQSLSR